MTGRCAPSPPDSRAPTTARAGCSRSTPRAPTGAASSRRCARTPARGPPRATRTCGRAPGCSPTTPRWSPPGADYLEVMRSDLVKTLEYGAVPAPVQAGRQPRPGCTHASTALGAGRLGLVERCPDEDDRPAHRLVPPTGRTVPRSRRSSSRSRCPARRGARGGIGRAGRGGAARTRPRLLLYDHAGQAVGEHALDVPEADRHRPTGRGGRTSPSGSVSGGPGRGRSALDPLELTPQWTVPDTLGPAVPYGGGAARARPGRAARDRPRHRHRAAHDPGGRGPAGPVRLAALGEVLLEQRGREVVALVPAG